jgi:hypothetical protein
MAKLKVTPDGIEAPKKKLQKVVVTTKKDYSLQDNKTLKKLNRTLLNAELKKLIPNDKKSIITIFEKPKNFVVKYSIYAIKSTYDNKIYYKITCGDLSYHIDKIEINYIYIITFFGLHESKGKLPFKYLFI